PDVVLGQQYRDDPRVRLGLVTAQPEQLRGGIALERTVSGQLDEAPKPDRRLDLAALGGRSPVVPQDRRADHAAVRVEADEPVHLPGEADSFRLGELRKSLARGPHPVARILFGPAGTRRRERITALRAPDNRARLAERDRLQPARADVDAEDEFFAQRQTISQASTE